MKYALNPNCFFSKKNEYNVYLLLHTENDMYNFQDCDALILSELEKGCDANHLLVILQDENCPFEFDGDSLELYIPSFLSKLMDLGLIVAK